MTVTTAWSVLGEADRYSDRFVGMQWGVIFGKISDHY